MHSIPPLRTLLLALPLALLALAGCETDAAPRLHDLYLYDRSPLRISYLYGDIGSFPQADGRVIELAPLDPASAATPDDGPAPRVPTALAVDGEPYLTAPVRPIAAPFEVQRIPLTTDLQVRTRGELPLLTYWDGRAWLTVAQRVDAGLNTRIAPRPRIGRLRGLAELTNDEADALADRLEASGDPLLVAELPGDAFPERSVDGLAEYLRSGVYVQRGLSTDPSAFRPPAEEVVWEVLAQGGQATAIDTESFQLIRDQDALASAWSRVHAGVLQAPPLPDVDFRREAVAAIYLGSKPSGGYGIEVEQLSLEDGDVYVDVNLIEPAAGEVVSQALTSPWLMIRILRGNVDVVWFRDPDSGRLLGVARNL